MPFIQLINYQIFKQKQVALLYESVHAASAFITTAQLPELQAVKKLKALRSFTTHLKRRYFLKKVTCTYIHTNKIYRFGKTFYRLT